MRGSGDPIVSDREQSNDNITNTCLGWIDERARNALPTRKQRNNKCDAEAIHDR